MVSEGADNNYHIAGGASQKGPDKFTLADLSHDAPAQGDGSTTTANSGVDDKLRVGIYNQTDAATTEARSTGPTIDVGRAGAGGRFDQFDQAQLATVMQEFGDLTLFEGATGDQVTNGRVETAVKAHGDSFAVARADTNDRAEDDHDHDLEHESTGNRDTQDAVARLSTMVAQGSQIPDRMLQTFDRLNRQAVSA